MAWRVAKSLLTLRDQINAMAPNRSKKSDGTVGDLAHQKTASDHHPGADGVVEAADFTHDPAGGFDSWKFAEMLRIRRDHRIEYVISNGRIFFSSNWAWKKYTGPNPHSAHVHVSVMPQASVYDDPKPWDIGGNWNSAPVPIPIVAAKPLLRRGSTGDYVELLQKALGITADTIFGQRTDLAVRDFQKSKGLVVDGLVGPATWAALDKK